MHTFLEQSRTFMRAITESFHLINTSRAGVALLADQITRIHSAGLDDRVIEALYPMPPGTTGQNLRAHTLRAQGEKDRDLAEMWLLTVFARYESWAESLELEYAITDAKRGCQFPIASGGGLGFGEVFGQLTADPLMTAIYSDSVEDDDLWLADAEAREALVVYRYYKEVRNSLVHSDGRAKGRLVTAAVDAQAAAAALMVGTKVRTSVVPSLNLGDPISLDFEVVRNVIALLRALVFSIDARVLLSTIGKTEFASRWNAAHGEDALKVIPKKLGRSPWFDANISIRLAMPAPVNSKSAGPVRGTWPATSRDAFTEYATARGMIRKLL